MPTDPQEPNVRICHDCGYENPAAATSCAQCNFPLGEGPAAPAEALQNPVAPPAEPATPAEPGPVIAPPPRLRRLREQRRRKDPSLTLWLAVGGLGVIALLYMAVQGFQDSNFPKVEGAQPGQQARADQLRALIQEDSTNVAARVALGDVLYDTGNWPDAIVEYRAAVRMDSTKIEALVDLGVCYYNLGHAGEAQRHFELALAKNPRQTVALFNMGIINERRNDPDAALRFYQRALETDPPEPMRQPIMEAIARARQATGRPAPPLPQGR